MTELKIETTARQQYNGKELRKIQVLDMHVKTRDNHNFILINEEELMYADKAMVFIDTMREDNFDIEAAIRQLKASDQKEFNQISIFLEKLNATHQALQV